MVAYGPLVGFSRSHPKVFMTTSTSPETRQRLIPAVPMVCALPIRLDDTVLSTALETLADPVRGLTAREGDYAGTR